MSHRDAFMRIALKAQNQCRMTLETLATKKTAVGLRQSGKNENGGQQQVDDGGTAASRDAGTRARGEIPNHASRTMGGNRCATAGQPSGERGKRN